MDAVAPIGVALTSAFYLTATLQTLVMVPTNWAGRVLDGRGGRIRKTAAVLGSLMAGLTGVTFAALIASLTVGTVDDPRLKDVIALNLLVALTLTIWTFFDSHRWRTWLSTTGATAPLSDRARRGIAFAQTRNNNIRLTASIATGMALSIPIRDLYADFKWSLDVPQFLAASCLILTPGFIVITATQMSPNTELVRVYRHLKEASGLDGKRHELRATRLLRLVDLSLSRQIRAKPEPLKSAYRLKAEGLIADVALAVHRRDIGDLAVTAAVRSCLTGVLPLPHHFKHTLGSSGMDWFNSARLLGWTLTTITIVTPGLTTIRILLPIANS